MRTRLFTILLLCVLTCLATPMIGQPESVPTIAEVEAKLAELGDDFAATPPPETTDEVILALRTARRSLLAAAASREQAAQFNADAQAAPDRIAELTAELATPPAEPQISPPPDATLNDLERRLTEANAELAAAQTTSSNLTVEQTRRTTRLADIPKQLSTAQNDSLALQQELGKPAPSGATAAVADARALMLSAQLDAAAARIAELQAEAASYNKRTELLRLRQSKAAREVTRTEKIAAAWQQLVNTRQQKAAAETARQASESDLKAAEQIRTLAPIAAQIRGLVEDLTGPDGAVEQLRPATTRLKEIEDRLSKRRAADTEIRRRAAADQASSTFGQLLQSTLRDLNDERPIRRQLASTRETIVDVGIRLADVRAIVEVANDTGKALSDVLADLGPDAERHEALARRLIEQRRTLAQEAQDSLSKYYTTLTSMETTYVQHVELTSQLREFIKARVFWVRSVPRGRLAPTIDDYTFDVGWLTDETQWLNASAAAAGKVIPSIERARRTNKTESWHYLVLPIGVAVMLFVAVLARWRLVVRARAPLPAEGRFRQMSMAGAFLKLALTIAAASLLPLALFCAARWLGSTSVAFSVSADAPTPAPLAFASGLARASYVLFGLSLLRGLTRRSGVGVTQFRWSEPALSHFRWHLRWLTPIAAVVACLVQTYEVRSDDLHPEAIGRTSLILGLLVAGVFQWLVFSPRRPFTAEYIKRHRRGLIERSAWAWFPLLVAIPVMLAIGAAAGYVYTALQIQRTIGNTYLFVLVVIIAQALVLRSLQLARRRIAIEAARARATAAAQSEQGDTPAREPETVPEVDLTTISLQSRKVVQVFTVVVLTVGLYAVWNDVLPALRWFERLQVLPTLEYIDPDAAESGTSALSRSAMQPTNTSAAGDTSTTTSPGTMPGQMSMNSSSASSASEPESLVDAALPSRVTVADLGLTLLLILLTISASRNLPGLLEITLLPKLPLDAATRYAIFSIARYVIIIVGVFAISKTLSIPWRSAQWLAAALTFGLAFGLQEIFANFVSGLIMLFEQPVRVGDTVTVSEVSGTVSKIRMRATTIVNWDNKELIIPNKVFITDQVINWTLSDPISRVVVPVGIAYGSNTELARELLLKAADQCPHTIDKPEPKALFLGFGDNSLNFSLRVYIDTIDNLLASTSDLHFRIDRLFRDADIEISFPQRDLHIRSLDPAILDRLGGARQIAEPPKAEPVSGDQPGTTEAGAS